MVSILTMKYFSWYDEKILLPEVQEGNNKRATDSSISVCSVRSSNECYIDLSVISQTDGVTNKAKDKKIV